MVGLEPPTIMYTLQVLWLRAATTNDIHSAPSGSTVYRSG